MKRFLHIIKSMAIVFAVLLLFAGLLLVTGGDTMLMRFAAEHMEPLNVRHCFASEASPVMLDRHGALLYAFLAADEQWRFPVSLDNISPLLIQATLATEDKRFYEHAGVDSLAALRAIWINLKGGRVISGASTLTMQLAKQHFPTPRTLPGKVKQAFLAMRLDAAATKDAILSAYLNSAPYGSNLIGIEAAALRYFGKPSGELTLPEAALLAGIPKSPNAFDPIRKPESAQRRRDHVLQRMMREGMITEDMYVQAIAQPLNAGWHEYPEHAPHLAMKQRDTIEKRGAFPTTLEGQLQARLERLLPEYLKRFDNEVTNGAVMVVDTKSGEVLARVASAGFQNNSIHGQVDLCAAPRAPGSALKPFVYALAMNNNLLYPTEVLLDNTLDYGVYNPANFDGTFNGTVSAGEALRWSLNVPAIQVQSRVGVPNTLAFLKMLGLDSLHRSPEHYGLGLVLGNCEVRLESLMEGYLALARLGEHIPLRLLKDQPQAASTRILPEGIALALWNMMEQPFPEEPWANLIRVNDRTTRLCWKTGTSTGYHDAWTVAFNCHYVVGAWVGNSDGRASNRLIGAHAALPLVAQVFRSLPVPQEPDWPNRDGRLVETKICAATGMPKSQWCPVTATAWLPREQYLHRCCDVHRPGEDGHTIACWPGTSYNWDLASVPTVSQQNSPAATTQTAVATQLKELDIISPANNATYVLTGEPQGDRIVLKANKQGAPLHWYHNEHYLGRSEQMAPLYFTLAPGEHRIACMDDAGQTAAAVFSVQPG